MYVHYIRTTNKQDSGRESRIIGKEYGGNASARELN